MDELIVALLVKRLEQSFAAFSDTHNLRGPRGQRGASGRDGLDFKFNDHADTIKSWAKEFALKFSDLSEEEVNKLRGPRGHSGKDGRDFDFEENKEGLESLCKEAVRSISDSLKLKFSDLSLEEVEQLRGERGYAGKDGRNFIFEENKDRIESLCREAVNDISDSLKLKFKDLNAEDLEHIRGPRGRDGTDGRDFDFEEHRAFFENLKPKFSDFTAEEVDQLRLHFSDLSEEDKASMKLRFNDLTVEERLSLKGARGARGQRGGQGADGKDGTNGARGLPGIWGRDGKDGRDGVDGIDGEDAPYITDIQVDQIKNDEIEFVFDFSDGTTLRTDTVKLPKGSSGTVVVGSGDSSQSGSGVPPGGTTGQILTKLSDTDGDADWQDAPTPPAGSFAKADTVLAGDFSGPPFSYQVVFTTPFVDSRYSIALSYVDQRPWTISAKDENGFTIDSNSIQPLSGDVDWTATPRNNS